MVAETRLSVDDLIAPLFVREGITDPQPIASIPGVMQHTLDSLRAEVAALISEHHKLRPYTGPNAATVEAFRRADLVALLEGQRELSHFASASWHCLLAGYGAFPQLATEQRGDVDFHRDRGIAGFLQGCALNFEPHAQVLGQLRHDRVHPA